MTTRGPRKPLEGGIFLPVSITRERRMEGVGEEVGSGGQRLEEAPRERSPLF